MRTSSGYVADCMGCGKPFMKTTTKAKAVCLECRNPTGRSNAYGRRSVNVQQAKSTGENRIIALEDRMAAVEEQLSNIAFDIETAVGAAILNIEEDTKRISERIIASAEREVVSLMKERVDKHVLSIRKHLNERIATLEEFVGYKYSIGG